MSADFDEVTFPNEIAKGATAGIAFRTDVLINSAGFRTGDEKQDRPLGRHNVSTGIRNKDDFLAVYNFFINRKGRLRGFRYRNFLDYQVTLAEGVLVNLTTTTWQLYKRYADDIGHYDRKIVKPRAGAVITGTGTYTLDTTTGIITKTGGADPTGTWSGDFDEPCWFDTDELQATLRTATVVEWPNIIIAEYPIDTE